MEAANIKILNKLSKSTPLLYQSHSPTDDFPLDFDKLWIPYFQFLDLQHSFPYFSCNPLISGILFSKSSKNPKYSQWFRAKFYGLYKDRLILYSVHIFFLLKINSL